MERDAISNREDDTDDVISTLNDLIETSRDGEKGFCAAAEHVDRAELRSFFEACAHRCAQGISELSSEVERLGGRAEASGSLTGALHRGWVDIKTAVASRDNLAVLREVERGEDHAVERYRDALQKALPTQVRQILEHQYEGVLQHHAHVRELRDRYASAA